MKKVSDLKTDCDETSKYYKSYISGHDEFQLRKTKEAVKRLKDMGKRPHMYGTNKIRLSHRGVYFDYDPVTGNWVYTRSSGRRKWNSSKSFGDFMKKMDAFMDWYDVNVRGDN
jgi:hypothetical protein